MNNERTFHESPIAFKKLKMKRKIIDIIWIICSNLGSWRFGRNKMWRDKELKIESFAFQQIVRAVKIAPVVKTCRHLSQNLLHEVFKCPF
jgi:hypothetical protein